MHSPFASDAQPQRAKEHREELSFQTFLQHATLFWPGYNTEFPFSVDKWANAGPANIHLAADLPDMDRNPARHGPECGQIWRAKSLANYTAMLLGKTD